MAAQRKRTQTIAGRDVTLVPGRRYVASRPMASPGMQLFVIYIRDITENFSRRDPVEVLECFTYDQANEFLAAFNNGKTSFDGRVW